jgi:hypothetical protein
VAVFERLPRREQAFTVSSLSREWHAWAAPRRVAVAGDDGRCSAAAPLWLLQQAQPCTAGGLEAALKWHGTGSRWWRVRCACVGAPAA